MYKKCHKQVQPLYKPQNNFRRRKARAYIIEFMITAPAKKKE